MFRSELTQEGACMRCCKVRTLEIAAVATVCLCCRKPGNTLLGAAGLWNALLLAFRDQRPGCGRLRSQAARCADQLASTLQQGKAADDLQTSRTTMQQIHRRVDCPAQHLSEGNVLIAVLHACRSSCNSCVPSCCISCECTVLWHNMISHCKAKSRSCSSACALFWRRNYLACANLTTDRVRTSSDLQQPSQECRLQKFGMNSTSYIKEFASSLPCSSCRLHEHRSYSNNRQSRMKLECAAVHHT